MISMGDIIISMSLQDWRMVISWYWCGGWSAVVRYMQIHFVWHLMKRYEIQPVTRALANWWQLWACVHDTETVFVSMVNFQYNFLDLQDLNMIPTWHRKSVISYLCSRHWTSYCNQPIPPTLDTQLACQTLTEALLRANHFTSFWSTFLEMTCQATVRNLGTSIGMRTWQTETCHGAYCNRNSIPILFQPHHRQV